MDLFANKTDEIEKVVFANRLLIDTNLKSIASKIFSKPPQPNLYRLTLDVDESNVNVNDSIERAQTTFEMISILVLQGVKILYPHVELNTLSQEQIKKIQEYCHSFGWELVFDNGGPDNFEPHQVEYYKLVITSGNEDGDNPTKIYFKSFL